MKARLATLLLLLACTLPASGRVTSIEILTRTPVLNNQSFGQAGTYEEITARIHYAVLPGDPHNRIIVDLDKAPRNAKGEVEFSADLFLLRPINGGNHALLLEIPNRGAKGLMRIVDGGTSSALPTTAENFGDDWLLQQGYTLADLGWQWDAPDLHGNLRLYAPVATDHGHPITGLLRDDFTPVVATKDWPLGHIIEGRVGGTEYPAMNPADPRNVLTVRDTPDGPRTTIPKTNWGFTSVHAVHLNSGFQAGRIYELVYTVKDPVVAGLGFAAVRDFVAWLKSSPAATPTPIAPVKFAYAAGISQCGRFLRDYLYEGFNQDESGHQALDGILAHVGGAGRGSFNYRFAQPSRDSQPMSSIFWPTDIFPFTDEPEVDPTHPNAAPAGLLDAARAEHDVPKVFLSHTSYEYWGRAASLIHTTADGRHDMPIGRNVRIYFFAGLQHFSGPFPPQKGRGQLASQNPQSFLPIRWFWRAMITNMNAWVQQGTEPPPSAYPHIADGTLVPRDKLAFPAIQGIHPPDNFTEAFHLDFGRNWRETRILTMQPPIVSAPFPILFPQVNRDGNAEAGIHLPEIAVPLATYTGWNLRDPATGASEERVSFLGSYLPFPKTEADRKTTGDPRLSIEERYSSREDYLTRYKKAVDDLVSQHWILPQDAPDLMKQGAAEWDDATK